LLAPLFAFAAACSRAPENGQAAAVALQPGLWETVDVFTTADISGVPDAVATQVRSQLNRPDTNRNCLTPQMAANPAQNLREGLARGAAGRGGQECRFSEMVYAGGVVRVRATCGPAQLTMDGGFTATTADIRLTTTAQGPAEGGGAPRLLRLHGTSTSRRVGDCPQ